MGGKDNRGPQTRSAHTPIPTSELNSLTKNVAEITVGVKALKDDILPPIAKDARKASDAVIQLKSWTKDVDNRVKQIEGGRVTHECINQDEINEHDRKHDAHATAITAQEKDIVGLTRWRAGLAAIMIPLCLFAIGAAAKAIADAATATAERGAQQAITTRHEREIDGLETARERDRQAIAKQIKALPSAMQNVVVKAEEQRDPSVGDVRSKLTPRSQRQLKRLLDEAGIDVQEYRGEQ